MTSHTNNLTAFVNNRNQSINPSKQTNGQSRLSHQEAQSFKIRNGKSHSRSQTTTPVRTRSGNRERGSLDDGPEIQEYNIQQERDDFGTDAGSDFDNTIMGDDLVGVEGFGDDDNDSGHALAYPGQSQGWNDFQYDEQLGHIHQNTLFRPIAVQNAPFGSPSQAQRRIQRVQQLYSEYHDPSHLLPQGRDLRLEQMGGKKRGFSPDSHQRQLDDGVYGTEAGDIEAESEMSHSTPDDDTGVVEDPAGLKSPSRNQRNTQHVTVNTTQQNQVQPRAGEQQPDQRQAPEYGPDYTEKQLKTMKYSDLKAQTWDSPAELADYTLPDDLKDKTLGERVDYYASLPPSNRDEHASFYQNLGPKEWEEAGDHLISTFADIIKQLKHAKAAKRKIMDDLELELEVREEKIRGKSARVDRELESMAAGGEGLLRGKS